jgi:hypothetical protein
VAPTDDESETGATGAPKHRARSVGETEQLVSVLGALLTECERVRAMGEVAAGRLRNMINDLEGRTRREPGASSADSPVVDAPRKDARVAERSGGAQGPILQGIRLEKSAPESSRVAIKHGLVVVGAVAFATLWALGIVAEVPQRPASAPIFPEEATESREPSRQPSAQAPASPAKPARVTNKAVEPAAPAAPTSVAPAKPDADLPPIAAGFTSRGFFSPSGHVQATKDGVRSRPDVDLNPAEGSFSVRPTEPTPQRGPSPESP